jgi:hypothetical protein
MKWKTMAKYHQNVYDNDEFDDFDDEDEHHEKKTKIFFYKICKTSDHNTDQCPSKVMSRSCPLKEIIPIHVVQIKMSGAQDKSNYQFIMHQITKIRIIDAHPSSLLDSR